MVEEESKNSSNFWGWVLIIIGILIIIFVLGLLMTDAGSLFDVLSDLSWLSSFGKTKYSMKNAFKIAK